MWLQVSFTLYLLWGRGHKALRFPVVSEGRKDHNWEKEKEVNTSKMLTVLLASGQLPYRHSLPSPPPPPPNDSNSYGGGGGEAPAVGQPPAHTWVLASSAWKRGRLEEVEPWALAMSLDSIVQASPTLPSTPLFLVALTLSYLSGSTCWVSQEISYPGWGSQVVLRSLFPVLKVLSLLHFLAVALGPY